jgi:hypothetical protein
MNMTQKNNLKVFPINAASLTKRMLLGFLVGLILISFFLYGAGEPKPEWGRLWMIRPLVIVPLAGALGGAFNYFISQQDFRASWTRTFSFIFSFIVFIIALWMGIVLGLDGTYWN